MQKITLDEAYDFFENKNLGALIFERRLNEIEYTAYLSQEFLGLDEEESYRSMVSMIALLRKISEYLTLHAAKYADLQEDDVKSDVADVYFNFKKNNIFFTDENA